jgi:hypothetical protein
VNANRPAMSGEPVRETWRACSPPNFEDGGWSKTAIVEVAGIEPASFGTSPGLLRAQPASFFSAPAVLQASRRRAQPLLDVPSSPAAGPDGGSS